MIVRAMSCLACAAVGVCMPTLAQGQGQADAGGSARAPSLGSTAPDDS